ncbi:acyltransferase [Pseudomonas kuykendallii]|uniref:Peptidoglycan/LPS O-acetylase OafA/YrhL, contains acyltransferase and SGNH-hydrolase domains n=1 Tax=Pseudomonas kuykendallii TaxID=1007099 RepID=A0A1H3D5K7_9PSED|nr:acyltransferase [Pseudomonas kuykendallii]MCQ4272826.1 acyltransferase [Pseudomonas kuykendallii]SDX60969.1 Peptidoglycan/LPS O-acetylase OafA/YrhL, contains acyltransferase and SGNH-hydrolase domains [Pseudomonas kuykendallii]
MLISLQALRAVAAWMVVCHHVMQVFFDFKADSPIGQFFVQKGAIGVDIFFVISGFVIYLSTAGKDIQAGRFLLNRIMRIVPAYWLYSLLMAAIILYAQQMTPGQTFELRHLILSLLFIPAENPGGYGLYPTLNVGWTLNYEMFFYLVFALSLVAPQRLRPLLIAVTLALVSTLLAHQDWLSNFYRNSILYEFLFGVAIGIAYRRGWIGQGTWLPLLILAASMALVLHLDASSRLLNWGVPSAFIVVACVALEPWFARVKPLKMLGDCSYSVYLVHVIVLSTGWYLYERFGFDEYWVIAACMPAILLISWASYQLIERRLFFRTRRWLEPQAARADA